MDDTHDKPDEHELIERYFAPLTMQGSGALGLGDDTALITPAAGTDLLLTADMIVAGIHFFVDDAPRDIAYKALAVNVSDIVAKGGEPSSYLMTIAFPVRPSHEWMTEFAAGLGAAQKRFGAALIGGDTVSTPGPLTISICLYGEIKTGAMVRRSGAAIGDSVFVSGTIGDAALGLKLRRDLKEATDGSGFVDEQEAEFLIARYLRPRPRLALARALRRFASGAMDISDGLCLDFERLCQASRVGGEIEMAKIPLSMPAQSCVKNDILALEDLLTGGDDYEILCTISQDNLAGFQNAAREAQIAISRIGVITDQQSAIRYIGLNGRAVELKRAGYEHFST